MTLEKRLRDLLNTHSAENTSNTPDFILAQYMMSCLGAFDTAVQQRENWYGRDPRPTAVQTMVGTDALIREGQELVE